MASDAWDGRPEQPERDGWHWLSMNEGTPVPTRWDAQRETWTSPPPWGGRVGYAWLRDEGFRYLGPCLPPSEVATLRADLATARAEGAAAWDEEVPWPEDFVRQFVALVLRDACELPDYTSPEGQPELLQMTCSQLEGLIDGAFEAYPQPALPLPPAASAALAAVVDRVRAEERAATKCPTCLPADGGSA